MLEYNVMRFLYTVGSLIKFMRCIRLNLCIRFKNVNLQSLLTTRICKTVGKNIVLGIIKLHIVSKTEIPKTVCTMKASIPQM
jgi:hypothetical protein